MIVTLTANPSIDRTIALAGPLERGSVLRAASMTSQAGGKGVNISRAAVSAGIATVAVLPAAPGDPFVAELRAAAGSASDAAHGAIGFRAVFARTTWRDRDLFAVTQAGFVNNLNDGMAWGVLPLLFAAQGLSVARIGLVAAVYPATWGLGQLFTGALSDRFGRKPFIVAGMVVQAIGHVVIGFGGERPFAAGLTGCLLLGAGTAMVYPTLLAGVGDVAHPVWRARALSVYRFWRDMGYAAGALMAGAVADAMGLVWAVHAAGALTLLSGAVAWAALRETVGRGGILPAGS